MQTYHHQRPVSWGHWGIDFLNPQPDTAKNFGVQVAHLPFAVSVCGPVDGHVGSELRRNLQAACDAWVREGALPPAAIANAIH